MQSDLHRDLLFIHFVFSKPDEADREHNYVHFIDEKIKAQKEVKITSKIKHLVKGRGQASLSSSVT